MLKYRDIKDGRWYGIDLMALKYIYAKGECQMAIIMKDGKEITADAITSC